MKCVRILGVAKQGRAIATWQHGRWSISLDKSHLTKSTSCITRECHRKFTDHNNASYKPEMK